MFSTNNAQLVHTVGKFYGTDFDSALYLNRFFDFQFRLADVDTGKYLKYIDNSANQNGYIYNLICDIGKFYEFSMREYNLYYQRIKMLNNKTVNEGKIGVAANMFGTVILALGIKDITKERLFFSGGLQNEISEIYNKSKYYRMYCDEYFGNSIDGMSRKDKVLGFYDYIFNSDEQECFTEVDIAFSSWMRTKFLTIVKK